VAGNTRFRFRSENSPSRRPYEPLEALRRPYRAGFPPDRTTPPFTRQPRVEGALNAPTRRRSSASLRDVESRVGARLVLGRSDAFNRRPGFAFGRPSLTRRHVPRRGPAGNSICDPAEVADLGDDLKVDSRPWKGGAA
jgi:hypothetical protein